MKSTAHGLQAAEHAAGCFKAVCHCSQQAGGRLRATAYTVAGWPVPGLGLGIECKLFTYPAAQRTHKRQAPGARGRGGSSRYVSTSPYRVAVNAPGQEVMHTRQHSRGTGTPSH